MSKYRKLAIVFPAAIGFILVAIMLLAFQVTVVRSQELDESQREVERAMAAEQPGFAATQPLPQLTENTIFPLFMGVDDATVPAYTMDPSTNISATAFSGAELWGAAYDSTNEIVYFNSGSILYEWPLGGAINLLGTIVDAGANAQAMVSLAFYDGQLYGTKNITNEAIWAIDTDTLVATVHIDYLDADLDIGGLAVDPRTGDFYGTNDDATPYGASLVRIEPGGAATVIAPYPVGQTDIDGLAISDSGIAYMIVDQPGSIYVYDLDAGVYLPPLTNPWTTSEVFAAGAYIYAGKPNIEVQPTSLQTVQPPDTHVTRQLTISNTGFADLQWAIDEEHIPALLPAAAAPPAYVGGSHPPSAGAVPAGSTDAEPARASSPSLLNQVGSLVRSWNSLNGPYFTIFDSNTPQILPQTAVFPAGGNFIGAGEYVDGLSYMVDAADNVYVVDDTGALQDQYTATAPPGTEAYSGMALDPLSQAVYAASTDLVTSTLFTFDVATGNATEIGPIDGSPGTIAISFDGASNLFGYDMIDDTFMQIDPATGDTSNVVPLPFDANFGQGLMYDPASGLLYMLAFNSGSFQGEFWTVDTVDPSAPAFTFVDVLGSSVPGGLNQLSWGGTASCAPAELPWVSTDPVSGTVPAGAATFVDVTFDAAGLATGIYTGTLCVKSNDPSNSLLRIPLTMTVAPPPSIVLTKTVGLDPALCATSNTLDLTTGPSGLQVTYCYKVTNTGVFTLNNHDLTDDRLGPILSDFPFDLAPGASAYLTSTTQLTRTTVNSATWTAVATGGPLITATATATATVTIDYDLFLPFIANSASNPASAPQSTPWTAPTLTAGLLMMVAYVRRRK